MILSNNTVFVNRFFYPDNSATAQLLSDLAFDLAAAGRDVTIVACQQLYNAPATKLAAFERIEGVAVHRVRTTRFGRGSIAGRAIDLASFYVAAFARLMTIVGRGDVVVAKTDPPLLSILAQAVARLRGAHVVNWLQDVYPEVAGALGVKAARGAPGRVLTAWRDASLRSARMNVVLGERMAAHITAAGVSPEQIAIAPNWSDERAVEPLPHDANPLREAWGLQDKFVVGYSGNLGRAHEWRTMLAAAAALQDDPRIRFLMIGAGHHTTALREAAEAAGVGNIIFQPYQPLSQLAASLSAADVHWLSLRPELEGLIVPSKLYGVLAAGRPVLAVTDPEGEAARIIRRHGCGLQVTPGDAAGFADAVRKLADDPARTRTLGEAARRAAEGPCSRQAALGRWRAILDAVSEDQLVERPAASRPRRAAAGAQIQPHGG